MTQYCFCGWPDERLLTVDAWAPQARDYVAPRLFPRRFSLTISLSCLLSPLLSSRSPFLSFPLDPDRQSLRLASCAAGWRHGVAARRRAPPLKEQRGREAWHGGGEWRGGCGEPPREARRRRASRGGAAAAVAGTSPRALAPGGSSELRRVFFLFFLFFVLCIQIFL